MWQNLGDLLFHKSQSILIFVEKSNTIWQLISATGIYNQLGDAFDIFDFRNGYTYNF